MELVVGLAVSSILLVAMVSASLFVQRYIGKWQKKDKLAEELAAIRREIVRPLESAQSVQLFGDSLKVVATDRKVTTLDWHAKALLRNGKNLTRAGLRIDSLAVSRMPLRESGVAYTFSQTGPILQMGLFIVFVRVSSDRGVSDSIRVVARNEYEYQKYQNR